MSNDTAAAALGGWLLWAVLPTERRSPPLHWALAAGALFGLALLTKREFGVALRPAPNYLGCDRDVDELMGGAHDTQ